MLNQKAVTQKHDSDKRFSKIFTEAKVCNQVGRKQANETQRARQEKMSETRNRVTLRIQTLGTMLEPMLHGTKMNWQKQKEALRLNTPGEGRQSDTGAVY